jgi:hypothetical protein
MRRDSQMSTKGNLSRKLTKSPAEIGRALREFSSNADSFAVSKDELVRRFLNKWIAIYRGDVAAASDDLHDLKRRVAALGIPPGHAVFRRVDRHEKVFIL